MLKQIQKLIPPPRHPIDVDETVLKNNVKQIGTAFPTDYIEYSELYGSGTIIAKNAYGSSE